MKVIALIVILFSVSVFAFAEGGSCWVEYSYSGDTNGPGGHGDSSSIKNANEVFIYRLCKNQCYSELPEYKNIDGIKSCKIDGVDIEDSPYKEIYIKNKSNICHVQVVGKYLHNIYLVENEEQCQYKMKEFMWCKKGAKCTYTLGQW
ncbi:hypothetical protein [Thalassolituus oleivorans]|jgi:hypothetical protein|uniref:Uncharacterized protein n=1 Tax=Thalassolituus oleivorans MIL-1 TaxID=1298593 RepID=M5DNW6_9GAMM|nr:hypothetical protein [Thalassolituus oleivorans]MCA6129403.1 hypothetical protein [Thalassolituus oleivorans 4BN06-13]CCU71645.1 hypothetical protein TOL_1217 [Thalassolituus oleivorans MIL-1]